MIARAFLTTVLLLAGAASIPMSQAAAADPSAAKKAEIAKAQKAKALQAEKAKKAKQAQLAKAKALEAEKAKKAKLAKAKEQEKKEWYAKDRDRGLDIASKYAPNTIAKVRKNNYIAKGDSVSTGGGKKGWQHYMNRYYSR